MHTGPVVYSVEANHPPDWGKLVAFSSGSVIDQAISSGSARDRTCTRKGQAGWQAVFKW